MRANHRSPIVTLCALGSAAALLASTGPAAAGPKRKKPAPARPDLAAAVATGDPVLACKAAIGAAQAGEHARASLVLPLCDAAIATAPELADGTRAARATVARVAERDDWSPVELVVHPQGAEATLAIDAFPGLPVAEGRVLLPAGRYLITAKNAAGAVEYDLALADGARALVLLEVATSSAGATGILDFGDGEPTAPVVGPPPKIRHGSLIPERYLRGLAKPRT